MIVMTPSPSLHVLHHPQLVLVQEEISPLHSISGETASFVARCGKKDMKNLPMSSLVLDNPQEDKVLSAATARHDEVVKLRMTAYNDLFAYDAKYHRSRLGHYLSKRNIEAEQRKDKDSQHQSEYEKAFNFIIKDIESTILSKHKSVTTLSQIRSNFLAKLNALDIDVEVYSWKLKAKLRNHFADRLVFIERQGVSDLVCSSTVTVGDALCKASELQNLQQEDSTDLFEEPDTSHVNEIQLLHSAAGILRRHMSNIVEAKHHYDPSSRIGIDPCAKFVPDLMYDFFMWLTDAASYSNVTRCGDDNASKTDIATISICHNIIAKSRNIRSPITLGLALYVHHEFGSRQLVQELHALGHSISYDEVRRFLTSAAVNQHAQDVYIPTGLRDSGDDRVQIDAGIDNFDQNEETLDGKSTTHAMASVVYERCDISHTEEHRIPRTAQKSTSNLDIDTPMHS